jgi:hypothetical protein
LVTAQRDQEGCAYAAYPRPWCDGVQAVKRHRRQKEGPVIRPLRAPSPLRANPREAAATAPPQSWSDESRAPVSAMTGRRLTGVGR